MTGALKGARRPRRLCQPGGCAPPHISSEPGHKTDAIQETDDCSWKKGEHRPVTKSSTHYGNTPCACTHSTSVWESHTARTSRPGLRVSESSWGAPRLPLTHIFSMCTCLFTLAPARPNPALLGLSAGGTVFAYIPYFLFLLAVAQLPFLPLQ